MIGLWDNPPNLNFNFSIRRACFKTIVLNMFFDNPTKEFHARELSRKTNLSIFAVLEAIKKLSKEELISVHKKGNMKIRHWKSLKNYYQEKSACTKLILKR